MVYMWHRFSVHGTDTVCTGHDMECTWHRYSMGMAQMYGMGMALSGSDCSVRGSLYRMTSSPLCSC